MTDEQSEGHVVCKGDRRGGADAGAAGTLALVVGPSGAGKDTLIDRARAELEADHRFLFVHRIVTRASDDASERHGVMSPAAFGRAEADGAFLLSWQAHGLGYGIPIHVREAVAAGRVVVANVSRTVVGAAEARVGTVAVLHVTAPVPVLARRIAARGREPVQEIEARLKRQPAIVAQRAEVIEIVNDGDIAPAVARFVAELRRLAVRSAHGAQ